MAAIRKRQMALLSTPEMVAKRFESLRRTLLMERFRVMSGEKQQTKRRISRLPSKTYGRTFYLRSKYNYFSDGTGKHPDVLYYDSETRRAPNEEYFTRKYGIKFKEGG